MIAIIWSRGVRVSRKGRKRRHWASSRVVETDGGRPRSFSLARSVRASSSWRESEREPCAVTGRARTMRGQRSSAVAIASSPSVSDGIGEVGREERGRGSDRERASASVRGRPRSALWPRSAFTEEEGGGRLRDRALAAGIHNLHTQSSLTTKREEAVEKTTVCILAVKRARRRWKWERRRVRE